MQLNNQWLWHIIFLMEYDLNLFQMENDINFVQGNLGSWFLVCNIVSTQFGTCRQHRKLIFGMQSYFDPTRWNMENNLNIFLNLS